MRNNPWQMSRRAKFGNKKVVVDGVTYDSKKEARRFATLQLREKAGEIRNLKKGVVFHFRDSLGRELLIRSARYKEGRVAKYTADAAYEERRTDVRCEAWDYVVEDTKSEITRQQADYKLRIALMEYFFGIRVREV